MSFFGIEFQNDVTVGSLTDTFTVTTTTANDTTPDPFYFANRDNQAPNTYIESNVIESFMIANRLTDVFQYVNIGDEEKIE